MNNQFDFPSLKQIYYFVQEQPNLQKLENFEKIIEFFRVLHHGDFSDFVVSLNQLDGRFGSKHTILLNFTPDFNDVNEFINWVINELSE